MYGFVPHSVFVFGIDSLFAYLVVTFQGRLYIYILVLRTVFNDESAIVKWSLVGTNYRTLLSKLAACRHSQFDSLDDSVSFSRRSNKKEAVVDLSVLRRRRGVVKASLT